VLVSAIATRGLCADVFRIVLAEHQLIVSDVLLNEVEKVLLEKLNLPKDIIQSFIDFIQRDRIISKTSELIEIELKDQTDLPILSSALFGGSEIFITGDRELLDLRNINDIVILSPRMFWEKISMIPSPFDGPGGEAADDVSLEEQSQ
jgi:predicted nucleic acid-binding protein